MSLFKVNNIFLCIFITFLMSAIASAQGVIDEDWYGSVTNTAVSNKMQEASNDRMVAEEALKNPNITQNERASWERIRDNSMNFLLSCQNGQSVSTCESNAGDYTVIFPEEVEGAGGEIVSESTDALGGSRGDQSSTSDGHHGHGSHGSISDNQLLNQARQRCARDRETADRCCGAGAVSCVGNNGEGNSLTSILMQTAMTATAIVSATAESCKAYREMTLGGSGINTMAAQSCNSKRNVCINSCEEYKRLAEQSRTGMAKVGVATSSINYCSETLGTQQAQILADAGANAAMASLGDQCEKESTASSLPPSDLLDCSNPSSLSNPYCKSQVCSRPGATETIPECSGYLGGVVANNPNLPNQPGFAAVANGGNDGFAGNDFTLDDSANGGVYSQGFDGSGGPIDPIASGVVQGQGGSGGGAAGGGSSGGGSSGSSSGSSAKSGSQGYNTKVANGVGSRGSSASKGRRRGGYRSGGGSSRRSRGSFKLGAGPKFNINDFLPKKKLGKGRLPASTFLKNGSVISRARHVSIWKTMSEKYEKLCVASRLSCPKKDRKKPFGR